jgi:hypothetical protein
MTKPATSQGFLILVTEEEAAKRNFHFLAGKPDFSLQLRDFLEHLLESNALTGIASVRPRDGRMDHID